MLCVYGANVRELLEDELRRCRDGSLGDRKKADAIPPIPFLEVGLIVIFQATRRSLAGFFFARRLAGNSGSYCSSGRDG